MDPFDEAILIALQDGKPRVFIQLLDVTGISRNTLRLHLENLANQGLVVKEKTPATGWEGQDSPISSRKECGSRFPPLSQIRLLKSCLYPSPASNTSADLKKADTASKPKRDATLKTALKSKNKNKNHFTPF